MKEKLKQNLVLRSIALGLVTFLVILLVPVIFRPNLIFRQGVPDGIWGAFLILVPAILGVVLLWKAERYVSLYVIFSALIQYALLIVFAGFVDGFWGTSIEWALGWFEYIGATFPWPAVIALIQWGVLTLVRKIKRK